MSGALIAGILQGLGQSKRDASEREERKEMNTLKKQMLQMQTQDLKFKQQRQAAQDKLINMFMQQYGGGQPAAAPPAAAPGQAPVTPTPQFSESFAPDEQQPGVAGQMAIAQMPPGMQAVLGEISGLDILGAGRLAEQRRAYEQRERQWIPEEYTDPTGAKRRRYRPKYGAPPPAPAPTEGPAPGAQPGVGTMVAPAPVESHTYEEEGKTYEVIRNKQTGEPVTEPQIIKPVKPGTSEAASKIALAKNALTYTDEMRSMMIGPDGKIDARLVFSANVLGGGVGQGRLLRAKFDDALDARARAATGAAMPQSEKDNYYQMYFPQVMDLTNPEIIADKFRRLESFMTDYLTVMDPTGRIRRQLDASGAPTSGAQVQLPQQAIDKLSEGKITTFKNGQKWTLQNGAPVRIQ